MKKCLLVLTLILLAVTVSYAAIQSYAVSNKVITELSSIRSIAAACHSQLTAAKGKLQSLNTSYGSEIVSDDKAMLVSLFSELTTTIAQLNTLVTKIDTDFPTIND